ncbi:hypothetical protein PTKIN_Ptkin02bG0142100 [Pterospermum kingtungense]
MLMALATIDELLPIFVPIIVYWVCSGMYVMLESLEKYKFYSKKEEDEKHLVSRMTVIKANLFHQTMLSIINLLAFKLQGGNDVGEPSSSFIDIIRQVGIAFAVLDTWSYFTHRYFHTNKWLCRHVHSQHNRLIVTYAFGGHYMHPIEGLSESLGSALSVILSGMSARTSMYFFAFALMKLVDDHAAWCFLETPFTSLPTIRNTMISTIS